MLTAADVEQKTFSTALRGYDLDEVDDFLDEVVATIRELNEKLEEAKAAQAAVPAPAPEQMPEPEPETPAVEVAEEEAAEEEVAQEEAAEEEVAEEKTEPAYPAIDESAVGRALIAAQTAADKLLEEAERQASTILEDAKEQADTWESEKEAKKAEAQAEMANLATRVRSVRSELAVLAEQVSGNLDDMDSVIASSGVDDAGHDDEVEDANQVTVLDSGDSDYGGPEAETGADDTDTANGADHLDQILTGVAADLQLGESGDEGVSDQEDSYDDDSEDSYDSPDGDAGDSHDSPEDDR